MAVSLAMSGRQHLALRRHLFPGDGCEAVALALCGRRSGAQDHTLLVREVVPVPYEICSVRTPSQVNWPTSLLQPLLDRALQEELGLVKIHSHPTYYPAFSATDDVSDRALFPSVYGWLDSNAPLASAIMLPDGTMFGRLVSETGHFAPLERIRVAGDDLRYWPPDPARLASAGAAHATRLVQTFGAGTYALLRRLRIGVVGCSGTGSIVIEQLARNCIGELVLVDPKRVESKNLNRILQATQADAEARVFKVDVMRRAIEAMGTGTRTMTHPTTLHCAEVLKDLAGCDAIFGCMDTVDGRDTLNRLATYYLVPYIDVGVKLIADGHGGIGTIVGTAHYLQPGGSSLLSRGVYTEKQLEAARLQRTDPARYEEHRKAGYISGVDEERPAVISVNMLYAALAVNEFLARLHQFRDEPNERYAIHRYSLSQGNYCPEGEGAPCPVLARHVGRGDCEPLLGLWELTTPKGPS